MTASSSSADRAIGMVRDAAAANESDPCRRGSLIELPSAGEVLVAGDLHGNQRRYEVALKRADLAGHADRHLILQELVHDLDSDTGKPCRSWQLLEMAARLKCTFPDRVHLLLGNHELAELCGLAISKHGCDLNERFSQGVRGAYGDRAAEVREAYVSFWRTLALGARTPNGVFISHSTPNFDKMGPFSLDWFRQVAPGIEWGRKSPVFDLIWGRDFSQKAADEFCRRVQCTLLLVGHTAMKAGYSTPNTRHVVLESKEAGGGYAILPLDKPLTQKDLLGRVQPLTAKRVLEW